MEEFKVVIFLMAILISLTAIVNKRKLPFPILLVAAGLVIGVVPQLPNLALDPDIVFIVILPPLLYDAAAKTSWHEFRTAIRPISALAITLVFFTTVAVAITAHYLIPGFSWPLAFVLGAVVSPPDAVTAVTTGTFIFWKAGLQFLLVAGVGIIIGIVVGYLFVLAHKKIENNPVVETSLTLLSPYVSYLVAEQFHMSGVLAVVTTGLVVAWRSPEVFSYRARMRIRGFWETLVFLLHGFVFILIGLQLPSIIKGLGNYPFSQILGYGLLISVVTIVVRIIWVFAGVSSQTFFQKKIKRTDDVSASDNRDSTWKNVLVVAWTGTRGVISLAAALALPLVLQDGTAFPKRNSIIFLAFVVIFITLVVQGLSLPLLIRWLKIKPQDNTIEEEKELQLYLATNTLNFIEQDFPIELDNKLQEQLKKRYELKFDDLTKEIRRQKKAKRDDEKIKPPLPSDLTNAQLEISKFKRELLVRIHKEGEFSDAAIKKVEREMDIDELKLELKVPKEE